jgi:hypothetical protein
MHTSAVRSIDGVELAGDLRARSRRVSSRCRWTPTHQRHAVVGQPAAQALQLHGGGAKRAHMLVMGAIGPDTRTRRWHRGAHQAPRSIQRSVSWPFLLPVHTSEGSRNRPAGAKGEPGRGRFHSRCHLRVTHTGGCVRTVPDSNSAKRRQPDEGPQSAGRDACRVLRRCRGLAALDQERGSSELPAAPAPAALPGPQPECVL